MARPRGAAGRIAAQRLAEQAKRARERRARIAVAAVLAAILIVAVALPSGTTACLSPKAAPMTRGTWADFAGKAIEDFPPDCLLGSGRALPELDLALAEAGYDRATFDAAARAARRIRGRPVHAAAAAERDLAGFIRPLGDGRLPEAPESGVAAESVDPIDELVIELSMRLSRPRTSGGAHEDE